MPEQITFDEMREALVDAHAVTREWDELADKLAPFALDVESLRDLIEERWETYSAHGCDPGQMLAGGWVEGVVTALTVARRRRELDEIADRLRHDYIRELHRRERTIVQVPLAWGQLTDSERERWRQEAR